ncbi:MAG: LPS assembly protein LptD [Desulfobacterales bacterium]|nr:LPS assembly protein LptD [Desulfobacterales bacterium]
MAQISLAGDYSASSLFENSPQIPWHIAADEIEYDRTNDQYIANGNVVISKKNKQISADLIRFDQKAMTIMASGNVKLDSGKDILEGQRMEMDLNSETGIVYDGTVFISDNHFYIKGSKIAKTGEQTYFIEDATATTCDGDKPAWKITSRRIDVTIEGYGHAGHAALWARRVPLLYTPYLFFPVKIERQSGLLQPQFAYSDRKGAELLQPLFWAINDSSDATFYEHYMDNRGLQHGAEYRYLLDENAKGTVMFNYLDDKQIDDGTGTSSEDWGYDDDKYLRTNTDRYWFRMKNDRMLPLGITGKLDLDIVSDQDYLKEFRDFYTGFDTSDEYYEDTFGRGLDDYNDTTRVNSLNFNKSWALHSLNAEFRWYDNVIKRQNTELNNKTLQQLPSITYDALKQQVYKTPFYVDANADYNYFYRDDGERGHRTDIHPRLYLPMNLKHYLEFEPSVGTRQTFWRTEHTDTSQDYTTRHRSIPDIKLDLLSELYSIFDLDGERINAVKHTVQPRIIYDYIPNVDQNNLPDFDEIDRIEKENSLTFRLTNLFTSRILRGPEETPTFEDDGSDKSNKETGPVVTGAGTNYIPPSYTYNQFCRFKLEQKYDFNEENESGLIEDEGDRKPWDDLYGELELTPKDYLNLKADASWDHYKDKLISHNISVTLKDNRNDKLFVEHRYEHDEKESIYTNLFINLTDRWGVYSEYEKNLLDDITLKTSTGIIYKSQCWSVDVNYTEEKSDRRYMFMIDLMGLGHVRNELAGSSVQGLWDNFSGTEDTE